MLRPVARPSTRDHGTVLSASRPVHGLQLPEGSFFLFGPRGTGKTTWLRQQQPQALFVNLLRPDTYRELAARPERLRELVRGAKDRRDARPCGRCIPHGGRAALLRDGPGTAYRAGPLVVDASDADATLAAYAGLYVEQVVQAEGLVRNVGAFARFLKVASFSHGAVLNASNVAREAQVNRKTVENYLEICEDLLLAFSSAGIHVW